MVVQNNAKIQPRIKHESIYNNLFEGQNVRFSEAKKKLNTRSFLNNKVSSQSELTWKIPLLKVASSNQKTLNNRNVNSQSQKSESIKMRLRTEKKEEQPNSNFNYIPLQQLTNGNQIYQILYSHNSISFERNKNLAFKGTDIYNNNEAVLLEKLIKEAYTLLSRIKNQPNEKENGTNSMLRSIKKFLAQKIQKKQKKSLQEIPVIIKQQKTLQENDFSKMAKNIKQNLEQSSQEKTVSSFNQENDSKEICCFQDLKNSMLLDAQYRNQKEIKSIRSSLETISLGTDLSCANINYLLKQVVSLKQKLDQQERSPFSK